MFTGTIMSAGSKGFWWAEQDFTRDKIFVHITSVVERKYLQCGDKIRFDIEKTEKGLRAKNVEIIWAAPWQKPQPGVRQ
jgi:cold shock CspA family protein